MKEMFRFLGTALFFVVAAGMALHFGFEIPYLSGWIGRLPGDLIIKKGGATIYVPLTTSALASILLTLIGRSK